MKRLILAAMAAALSLSATPGSAAEYTVALRNFEFDPNDLAIQVGDTVTFVNQGGFHNVTADDGSFGNSASSTAWSFSQTFNSAGEVRVYCSVHSVPGADINTKMNARITVAAAPTPAPSFQINQGISGSWYDSANPGQGFLIDVDPTLPFIFVAWFTYDLPTGGGSTSPGHLWLSGGDAYVDDHAQFRLLLTSDGLFDENSGNITNTEIGTATISFESCTKGSFSYQFDNLGVSGTISLTRLLNGGATLCEQLK